MVKNITISVLLALSVATSVHAAPRQLDSLSQPAVTSRLAEHSLLSDIARAGQRLVTVGMRGHILYSDDDARSWQQAQVPVNVTLTGVCFADERQGWAVGHRGVILATQDAGQTWSLQMQGQQVAEALVQAARDEHSELLESAEMFVIDGADKPFLAVHCSGPQQAVAVGAYGLALRTNDGGEHWLPSLAALQGTDQRHINALTETADGLYLAGEQGGLYQADLSLSDVQGLDSPYEGSFFGLLSDTDGGLLAYGMRGHVFHRVAGDSQWQQAQLNTTQSLTAGALLAGGRILLADASGIGWLSQDKGQTFREVKPEKQFSFTALMPLQDGSVIAVGQRGVSRFRASDLD